MRPGLRVLRPKVLINFEKPYSVSTGPTTQLLVSTNISYIAKNYSVCQLNEVVPPTRF